MSSSTIFKVPDGMSCVNALRALWEGSEPSSYFIIQAYLLQRREQAVSTAEKVADLFRSSNVCLNYVGGRLIKVDFSKFPKLDPYLYDQEFGFGAARKAIEAYNKVPPSQRFDKYDSYKFEELIHKCS